jgi:hypothetical protein
VGVLQPPPSRGKSNCQRPGVERPADPTS